MASLWAKVEKQKAPEVEGMVDSVETEELRGRGQRRVDGQTRSVAEEASEIDSPGVPRDTVDSKETEELRACEGATQRGRSAPIGP